MKVFKRTNVKGAFRGWHPKTIYELADGTKWKLLRPNFRTVLRQRPKATIYRDGPHYFLSVEGLNGKVPVRQVV